MTSPATAPQSASSGDAVLSLPRVAEIDPRRALESADWPPVATAPLELRQNWLPQREPAFRPGTIGLAATASALLVFAELTDEHIHTRAVADHEYLWELGDVFEIFLQPLDGDVYFEFEIAPNGRVLQLGYPHVGAARTTGIEPFIRLDRLIDFAVRAEPSQQRWRIAASIPVATLLPARAPTRGAEWRIACSRYDFDAQQRFTLSSTAALTQPNFHRVGEWSRVSVGGGFASPGSGISPLR